MKNQQEEPYVQHGGTIFWVAIAIGVHGLCIILGLICAWLA